MWKVSYDDTSYIHPKDSRKLWAHCQLLFKMQIKCHFTEIWMNFKRHLQSSSSVWAFFDQFNFYWTLPYVYFNILSFFLNLMKTDHFFCRETSPHPKFQLIYVYKMAKLTPPLKFFLEVIHKNKDRILIRIHGRTQKELNWLKIWPTDLERFLDCHFIFICLSMSWLMFEFYHGSLFGLFRLKNEYVLHWHK